MKKAATRSFSTTAPGVIILHLFSKLSTGKGPLKAYKAAELKKPFDAIIVPGVPYYPPKWDSVMKARVLWSYHLYINGFAKNIIYSGAAVYSNYVEARIMALYAEALGIPKEHIFCDNEARHSTENIYYSYQLGKINGFKTIALATDPFQSFFLHGFIRKHFRNTIYQLPIVIDKIEVYQGLSPQIDATTAQMDTIQPESFLQRIKGTLGWNINWEN